VAKDCQLKSLKTLDRVQERVYCVLMRTKKTEGIIPIHLEGFGTVEEKNEIAQYYGTHLLTKGYDLVKIVITELRRRKSDENERGSKTSVTDCQRLQEAETSGQEP
jgi:hypothetical protein